MDLQQFRAKVYELLTKGGMIESRGQIYYSESAVMDALEFIYHEVKNIPIDDFELKISTAAVRVLDQLFGNSQGLADEKQDGVSDFFDDSF